MLADIETDSSASPIQQNVAVAASFCKVMLPQEPSDCSNPPVFIKILTSRFGSVQDETSTVPSLTALKKTIASTGKFETFTKNLSFGLRYRDNDGDLIELVGDDDLAEAIQNPPSYGLKLQVVDVEELIREQCPMTQARSEKKLNEMSKDLECLKAKMPPLPEEGHSSDLSTFRQSLFQMETKLDATLKTFQESLNSLNRDACQSQKIMHENFTRMKKHLVSLEESNHAVSLEMANSKTTMHPLSEEGPSDLSSLHQSLLQMETEFNTRLSTTLSTLEESLYSLKQDACQSRKEMHENVSKMNKHLLSLEESINAMSVEMSILKISCRFMKEDIEKIAKQVSVESIPKDECRHKEERSISDINKISQKSFVVSIPKDENHKNQEKQGAGVNITLEQVQPEKLASTKQGGCVESIPKDKCHQDQEKSIVGVNIASEQVQPKKSESAKQGGRVESIPKDECHPGQEKSVAGANIVSVQVQPEKSVSAKKKGDCVESIPKDECNQDQEKSIVGANIVPEQVQPEKSVSAKMQGGCVESIPKDECHQDQEKSIVGANIVSDQAKPGKSVSAKKQGDCVESIPKEECHQDQEKSIAEFNFGLEQFKTGKSKQRNQRVPRSRGTVVLSQIQAEKSVCAKEQQASCVEFIPKGENGHQIAAEKTSFSTGANNMFTPIILEQQMQRPIILEQQMQRPIILEQQMQRRKTLRKFG